LPVGYLLGHLEGITHVSSKGDGRYLITNSKDQSIKLWDLRKMSSTMPSHGARHSSRTWDYRYGELNVSASLRKRFTGKVVDKLDCSLMTYRGHKVFQTLIRSYFSPLASTGQRYIYSGSFDGSIYIYDILSGNLIDKLEGHHSTIRDVSWHPYLPIILSASWDKTVRKWEYSRSSSKADKTTKSSSLKFKERRRE